MTLKRNKLLLLLLLSLAQSGTNWRWPSGLLASAVSIFPIKLLEYIKVLETTLNKKAKINFLPLQPGDVLNTSADMNRFMKELDYVASTKIADGIKKFINWYVDYYK